MAAGRRFAFLCWVFLFSVATALAQTAITLEPVVSGLDQPTYITSADDGTNRKFIVEQPGRILVLQPGASTPTVFLDIRSRVLRGEERGLLGLAFHPQYSANGRFFVDYTRQTDGATVIAEYRVSPTDPNTANPNIEIVLLTIAQPFANHNGGMVGFGPDNFLYIGMGDGGSSNDPGNRAQNIDELLGKILRIDVDHSGGFGTSYASPNTNPFYGPTPGRDEIFALGLRNPWRFSWDRLTGQLYVGDVGQNVVEEIDIVTRGGNYGWRALEGTRCTNLGPVSCLNPTLIRPIVEYTHASSRCSVTGGYVYRGTKDSLPYGSYVYADFCTGEIFLYQGGVANLLLDTPLSISSFGEDDAGEIYVVDLTGSIYRITNPAALVSYSHAVALPENGGMFLPLGPQAPGLSTGYAQIEATPGTTIPDGLALMRYRQGGILISETALRATPPVLEGRVFASMSPISKTAFVLASPHNQFVTVNFYFSDASGRISGQGSTSIPPGSQLASFLDEAPFNGSSNFDGTFTFSTSMPVFATTIQGIFNGRSEFVFASMPVIPVNGPPAATLFPQIVAGGGWTTDFVLMNRSGQTISGVIQLWTPQGQPGDAIPYSIPPLGTRHVEPSAGALATAGYARIVPSVGILPDAVAVLHLSTSAGIASQTSIPAMTEEMQFQSYAEMSYIVKTGLAVVNPGPTPVTVTIALSGLSGSDPQQTGTLELPPLQQKAMFLDEIPGLTSMKTPFQGTLRIIAMAPVGVTNLRIRTNERAETLLAASPSSSDSHVVSMFPHFATGLGFEEDLVWLNSEVSGAQTGGIYFYTATGQSLPVTGP